MRALSLGWGVQSWTLAAMSALGELPTVDVAIHSDTTHERQATYEFAAQWTPWLEARGVRVVTVSDARATTLMKFAATSESYYTLIPAHTLNGDNTRGQLRRQCTSRWKVDPMHRWLKTELAARGETMLEQWLGISLDEWHRAKDARESWITHRFPLLELNMNRADCLAWLKAHNLPSPGKSSCVFCPYHNARKWEQMKRDGGEDWQHAVEADEELRKGGSQWFVHSKRVPLEQAVVIPEDSGYSQLEMLMSDDDDAECDSGYCFL